MLTDLLLLLESVGVQRDSLLGARSHGNDGAFRTFFLIESNLREQPDKTKQFESNKETHSYLATICISNCTSPTSSLSSASSMLNCVSCAAPSSSGVITSGRNDSNCFPTAFAMRVHAGIV
jgi:hypothetical protein